MAWRQDADAAIANVIAEQQDDTVLVEGYVLIAAFVDASGEHRLSTNCLPGEIMATTLGLLREGLIIEEESFRQHWFEDDDG